MDKIIDKQKQAEYAKKYNAQRAIEEEYCSACKMPVKKISLLKHNLSKKHIQNSNKNIKTDVEITIMELFEKYKNGKMIFTDFTDELSMILDDLEDEGKGDNKIMPKCNTDEERIFCEQPYASMSVDVEKMIENIESITDQEDFEEQKNKINSLDDNAKVLLLNLWRRIKYPKVKTIQEPKQIQAPKPILKKVEPIQYLNEEFPEYDKFIKATNKAKYDCLEFIFSNRINMFEEDEYKRLTNALAEDEDEIEYDYIYEQVLISKKEYEYEERRQKSRISYFDNDDEEEEEQEEEEED